MRQAYVCLLGLRAYLSSDVPAGNLQNLPACLNDITLQYVELEDLIELITQHLSLMWLHFDKLDLSDEPIPVTIRIPDDSRLRHLYIRGAKNKSQGPVSVVLEDERANDYLFSLCGPKHLYIRNHENPDGCQAFPTE